MKKYIFILTLLFSFSVSAQDLYWYDVLLDVKNETAKDFEKAVDDIADQELKLDIKIKQFKEFKEKFVNKDFNNQIIKNMYKLIDDTGISKKIVYDLFDGVESDLKNEVKIDSKKELLIYSYRVAGTVGLMMAKK